MNEYIKFIDKKAFCQIIQRDFIVQIIVNVIKAGRDGLGIQCLLMKRMHTVSRRREAGS